MIKDLVNLCNEDGTHVEKITDILVQLLQTVDVHEQQMVHNSLMKLLNQPKRTRGKAMRCVHA